MGEVTVTRYRPIKLIAVVFTALALLLIIISVAAAEWVDVKFQAKEDAYRSWGLWQECNSVTSSLTICVQKPWMQACAGMIMLSLFGAVGALVLGIVGLITHRRLLYVIAGVLTSAGALFILITVIVFPVKFSADMNTINRDHLEKWDFDWTYGICLGGLFFMIGAAVFFLLKQENAETSHEKYETYPPYYINSSTN